MGELSWEPVRRGAIYCAPGCGMGCTWSAHVDANVQAKKLAADLEREFPWGWVPRVHENLGWHWGARAPHVGVSPAIISGKIHGWMAFVNRRPNDIGGHWHCSSLDGKTPVLAVRVALSVFEQDLEELERVAIKLGVRAKR